MAGFVAQVSTNESQHRRQIAEAANQALRGESYTTGRFTWPASAASHTIADSRIGYAKLIVLVPLDAVAAWVPWYVTDILNGSAVVNTPAAPASDCEFGYHIVGTGAE